MKISMNFDSLYLVITGFLFGNMDELLNSWRKEGNWIDSLGIDIEMDIAA